MATYLLQVNDSSGNGIAAAKVFVTDEHGNAIMQGGLPLAFETDTNGALTFQANDMPVHVRVQATGYASKNISLMPMQLAAVIMEEQMLAGITVEAARTFYNKYKVFIFLLIALVMFYLAIRLKILKV